MINSSEVDRNVNDNLKFNQETEFIPILGLLMTQLNSSKDESDDEDKDSKFLPNSNVTPATSIQANHHPALLSLLAKELSVAPEEICDFELYVTSHLFLLCMVLIHFEELCMTLNQQLWVV
jgi:aspartyl aminopeptidase